jgi:hypothetical protein
LDNRQTFFRLVTSRYARLEKSIILASAVSYQNHPQRIVNVGGIAAMLQLANNAIFHALKSLGYGVIHLFKPLLRVGLRSCRGCREQMVVAIAAYITRAVLISLNIISF